jgi:DNA-binding NtrC family response regulator
MMPDEDGPKTSTLARTATLGRIEPLRMCVTEGPDRGQEALLREGTAVIGTRADCTLVLTDSAVSRRHASVELLGSRVRVRDLGSKNGTRYMGARIETVEIPLGSTVRIGESDVALLPARVAQGALSSRTEIAGLLGKSVRMRRLFAEIERVGPSDAPVLIQGATGTGKEGVARALHQLSARAPKPFRVFDCAATQRDLLPAALFGHIRGAFTGAIKDAPGALEEADGGTLFLDEIAELPIELQPTLLRALETRSFSRVGEPRTRSVDFRIVAATHQDLEALVEQGRFRRDLYFRLAAIILQVPALKERAEDIPLLAEHFALQVAGQPFSLPSSAVATLCAYQWPGNVRELRNTVERVVTLGPQAILPDAADKEADFHEARERAIQVFEKSYLEALLERHGGSASAAAREAKIARSYFYRLLEEHGLKKKGKDEPG